MDFKKIRKGFENYIDKQQRYKGEFSYQKSKYDNRIRQASKLLNMLNHLEKQMKKPVRHLDIYGTQ